MSKYDKKWREENPEKWRECNRKNMAKWRKKNKDKAMINQMRSYMRRFPKIALEFVVAQNSTPNNISSEEICNNIMEVLLSETGIFAHCDLTRRLEIKNLIKSVIDCSSGAKTRKR